MMDTVSVGAFAFAQRFNEMLGRVSPVHLLESVVQPLFVSLDHQKDPERIHRYFSLLMTVAFAVCEFLCSPSRWRTTARSCKCSSAGASWTILICSRDGRVLARLCHRRAGDARRATAGEGAVRAGEQDLWPGRHRG